MLGFGRHLYFRGTNLFEFDRQGPVDVHRAVPRRHFAFGVNLVFRQSTFFDPKPGRTFGVADRWGLLTIPPSRAKQEQFFDRILLQFTTDDSFLFLR